MYTSLAHSESTREEVSSIIETIEGGNNKFARNIISIFQVGSTVGNLGENPKYEDNFSSDIDLIFVGDSDLLLEDRLGFEKYVSEFRSGKIEVWLKSELQYKEPQKYFRPGHPAAKLNILDGWDGLARQIGQKIEAFSGRTIWGEEVVESLREKLRSDPHGLAVPPEEGNELVNVAIRDLLKGLSKRSVEYGVEAILSEKQGILGLAEEEVKEERGKIREAFDSYLKEKRHLPKQDQDLTRREKEAKNYVLTKDNDVAKAVEREFLGVYCQAKGKFISTDPHDIYRQIKEEALLSLRGEKRRKWRQLMKKAYTVKTNNLEKDSLLPWDWYVKESEKNRRLVDLVSGFSTECLIYTSGRASMEGYTWTHDFQKRMNHHLRRRAPGIIEILSDLGEEEFSTLRSVIDLYIGEIVDIFTNRLETPSLEERLNSVSQYREDMVKLMREIVKEYDLHPEIIRHQNSKLLQIAQTKLMIAQNIESESKRETSRLRRRFCSSAKKTLEELFKESKENKFTAIIPERRRWTIQREALAHSTLGECLLELGDNRRALRNVQKSIEINPRNAYVWRLLGETVENEKEQSLCDSISKGLEEPNSLISLRLVLENPEKLEERLYSPWEDLIERKLDEYVKNVSVEIEEIMHEENFLFSKVENKEENLGAIINRLCLLDGEKRRLKDFVNSVRMTKEKLREGEIAGEYYFQVEKAVARYKRNILFDHQRKMEEGALSNEMVERLKRKKEIESNFGKRPTESQVREWVDATLNFSYKDVRERLKKWKEKGIISNKEYERLWKKTLIPLPNCLSESKQGLRELLSS